MNVHRLALTSIGRMAVLLTLALPCFGHGVVGKRMFVEPLFTEDANVKNELVFPRAEFLRMADGTVRSATFSLEKEVWHDRWSVSLEQDVSTVRIGRRTITGFDNLEIGSKVVAYSNETHEIIVSPALSIVLPTGSAKITERAIAVRPAVFWAKGLGDLKQKWLRPAALQGDFAEEFSLTGERERLVSYDVIAEYSIPYLNHFVRLADRGYEIEDSLRRGTSFKAITGDLFPFAEFNGQTPVSGTPGHTTSFLRPGLLYMGKYIQVTVAADVPLRSELAGGNRGTGAVILIDLFLDRISPAFDWTPFGRHRD